MLYIKSNLVPEFIEQLHYCNELDRLNLKSLDFLLKGCSIEVVNLCNKFLHEESLSASEYSLTYK